MLKVRCYVGPCFVSSPLPLVPSLMVASAESRLMRTSNKEAISDIIPNLPVRGDDCEQMHPANTKILRRATLKTDFYIIPITGMFCGSLVPHLNLYFSVLISRSDLLSFLVSGWMIALIKVSKP
jgi:hypothetical protein